jgi:ferredoxin-NADP reductase
MRHHDAPGLLQRLAAPLVAALTTPHGVDAYLEHVDPLWSLGEVRARVVTVRRETADAVTLGVRPNRRWRGFRAGQHVRVSMDVAGVRRTRCYSLSSSAHREGGLVEITVKRHPGGLVSGALVDGARAGQVLTLSQAQGEDFVLPEPRPAHVVLVSGGSGITPCMAILRTLVDEGHTGRITFLHFARAAADVIFAGELAALAAAHPGLTVDVRHTRGAGPRPRLDGATLARLVPDLAAADAWVCGPAGLVDAARALWTAEGLADRLRTETFAPPAPSPTAATAATAPAGALAFARSGRTVTADGRTLLEQAEAAGLRPESGCRMGICMSCKCKKVAGTVRDLRTGAVSDAGDDDIQLCVSVPVGDVTLDL